MNPRMLDLYCCQGGASMGYQRARFRVYGVDLNPQPNYPFPFHRGDALDVLDRLNRGESIPFIHPDGTVEHLRLEDFDAGHASPPCQRYTDAQRIQGNEHPDLIGPTRQRLDAAGIPYVIENVVGAVGELINPVMLCGEMFGLETYRHRLFESNIPVHAPEHPAHTARTTKMGRPPVEGEYMHIVGNFSGVDRARGVMGMQWANRDGLREAIPPVYAQHIGVQLLAHIERAAA